MFEYTKQNHFKFGYEDAGWFVNRSSSTQKFICDYGKAATRQTFREANVHAANYIANIATDDIFIMMSGGADSEIAARAFIDAGINFTAAIMRFKNGLNQHDISFAERFCSKHNISIYYFDLDITQFLFSDCFESIVKLYQTTAERAASIYLASQIPGFAILGQGEPVVLKTLGKWCFQEKERICSWNKFWIYNNKPGIPGFHQFSPEQILAVLEDQMTIDMINDRTNYWINDKFKHAFYKKHYPEFELREKYTGFEELSTINIPIRERILATFPYFVADWEIPIDQMLEKLRPCQSIFEYGRKSSQVLKPRRLKPD
jgi:hypothetical protein